MHALSAIVRNVFSRPVLAAVAAIVIVLGAAAFFTRDVHVGRFDQTIASVAKVMVARPGDDITLGPNRSAAVMPNRTATHNTPVIGPMIARTATIAMRVGDVDAAVDGLTTLARSEHGDVLGLDVRHEPGASNAPTATMKLRVPEDRFDAAMSRVGRDGRITERTITGEDVSSDITDTGARLKNLQQTEDDIRAIMGRSGTVEEVMNAETQLSQVREQIETTEANLKVLRGRVAYATIDVTLTADAPSQSTTTEDAGSLATTWHDALQALVATSFALLRMVIWLVAFSPLVLMGVAIAFLARRLRQAQHGA